MKWMTALVCMFSMFTQSDIEMKIQDDMILITVNEDFEGSLYLDDLKIDDIELKEGGMYSAQIDYGIYHLYDNDGNLCKQVLNLDDKFHYAFSSIPISKENDFYLFNQEVKTYVYLPEGEVFIIEEQQFQLMEHSFNLIVDETIPTYDFSNLKQLDEFTYLTSSKILEIPMVEESYEWFSYPEYIIEKDNQLYLALHLQEGSNDVSDYFKDAVNNVAYEKLTIILDTKAPIINEERQEVYTNQSYVLEFKDEDIDLEKSIVTLNKQPISLSKQGCALKESGDVYIELIDNAGNKSVHQFILYIDHVFPYYIYSLDENTLSFSYSEALKEKDIELYFNDMPLEIIDDKAMLNEEGYYIVRGSLTDLSGNRINFEDEIMCDINAPVIEINDHNQTIFLKKDNVKIEFKDDFITQWKVDVYKNNQLIDSFEGNQEGSQEVEFEACANASYRIDCLVKDTKQETTLSKEYIMDAYCSPINLKINGHDANNVSILTLRNDTTFEFDCDESSVFYRLYLEDGTVQKAFSNELIVSENDKANKLELYACDQYGFSITKTIDFEKVETLSLIKEETTNTIEKAELIIEKEQQQNNVPIMLGGALCVAFGIGQIMCRILRNKNKQEIISEESTKCISDYTEAK